jgi:hypothetical protein
VVVEAMWWPYGPLGVNNIMFSGRLDLQFFTALSPCKAMSEFRNFDSQVTVHRFLLPIHESNTKI